MNTSEVISGLVEAEGGACVLDKTYLPYHDPSAGPAAKFGLGGELFLDPADRNAVRGKLLAFLVDYWERFPDAVNQFLRENTRQSKKFSGSPQPLIEEDMAKYRVDQAYSGSLSGAVDIGLHKDDIRPYQGRTLISRAESPRNSYIRTSIPLCDAHGHQQIQALLSAFSHWCALLKPLHGSAGFTIIVSPGMEQNSVHCHQLLKRFPGFDFPEPGGFAGEAMGIRNRIKCVNWLTALGDAIVSELGGIATLRAALEPACTLHEYEGGVVIQAGVTPRLGDTQRGDVPGEYRLVARATQAVRFEDYSEGLFRVAPDLDEKKETLAWIRRFD